LRNPVGICGHEDGVVLLLIVTSVLSLARLEPVTGFSTGACGCVGGGLAVGGLHLAFLTAASAQEGMNATLFDAATVVWLDGASLEPNMPTTLSTGQDISFRIKTFQLALRGFLIRVEAADPDVTVVFGNNDNLPVFAYDSYIVSFTQLPTKDPTKSPTTPPVAFGGELDCTFPGPVAVLNDGSLLLRHIVNRTEASVKVQLEYDGIGWLGATFVSTRTMVPNVAIIGLPDTTVVQKSGLTAQNIDGVQPLPDSSRQTLTDATIEQDETKTVLVEDGEVAVSAGAPVTVMLAYGFQMNWPSTKC
jgi:hypothetical protein